MITYTRRPLIWYLSRSYYSNNGPRIYQCVCTALTGCICWQNLPFSVRRATLSPVIKGIWRILLLCVAFVVLGRSSKRIVVWNWRQLTQYREWYNILGKISLIVECHQIAAVRLILASLICWHWWLHWGCSKKFVEFQKINWLV